MSRSTILDQVAAQEVKDALAKGASVREVASEKGHPYVVVHRIATGKAWASLAPEGPIVDRAKESRGARRKIPIKTWYWIWAAKRRNMKIADIAKKTGVSRSTVFRLIDEFRLMLAHEALRTHLTSGSYEPMKRKFGIRRAEAQTLDEFAQIHPLPERLVRIRDREFPKLEKYLKKKNGDSDA